MTTMIIGETGPARTGEIEGIILNQWGFPERGLQSLLLFDVASGTSLVDKLGGPSGVIDSVANNGNAFARLAGGGISLTGSQLASKPAFEHGTAHTIFTWCRIVDDRNVAGEDIAGLIGTRDFVTTPRGYLAYTRGVNELNVVDPLGDYNHRPANGTGSVGTAEALEPQNINLSQVPTMVMIGYNGTNTVTTEIWTTNGTLRCRDDMTVTAAQLFTIAATTISNLQWALGGPTSTYSSGVVQHECAARSNRAPSDYSLLEKQLLQAAGAALGATRGRAWA